MTVKEFFKNKYFWITIGVLILLAIILWATGVFETKVSPIPPETPATPPAQPTPTDPKTYGGGFKWDATEKKCYGIFSNGGKSWVSEDECKSRGLIK